MNQSWRNFTYDFRLNPYKYVEYFGGQKDSLWGKFYDCQSWNLEK